MLKQQVQTALRVLFPPTCSSCRAPVESEFALCGKCWRDVPTITGPICDQCGVPILDDGTTQLGQCEACHTTKRPWRRGRAAMLYSDIGRKMVLSLKHGDRPDLAAVLTPWLVQASRDLVRDDTVIVPVPLHWRRLLKRKYNQSALLAQNLALRVERPAILDLLIRSKSTAPLDGVTVHERFERLEHAIQPNPARIALAQGKSVLIIDDVMTSGATLAAASEACYAAGAHRVDVLVLARVSKDA